MKKLLPLIIFAFFIAACGTDSETGNTNIKGTIKDAGKKMIYLNNENYKDSVETDSDGNFSFALDIEEPMFFYLALANNSPLLMLLEKGENVEIEAGKNYAIDYKITGSEGSQLIQDFGTKLRSSTTFDDIRNYAEKFIDTNAGSLVSVLVVSQQVGQQYLFNPFTDFNYYNIVDSTLISKYPENSVVKAFHASVENLKTQVLAQKSTGVGSEAPNIIGENPDGKLIDLKSYRGKYVLLDFWASWCAPCRGENPNLVSNYAKYKNKGFEIFQVSLDRSKGQWIEGIKTDKLDWVHVSDLKYWQSDFAKLYSVTGIPASFLLDKEGKIIAKDLRGAALGIKLKEIFGE